MQFCFYTTCINVPFERFAQRLLDNIPTRQRHSLCVLTSRSAEQLMDKYKVNDA